MTNPNHRLGLIEALGGPVAATFALTLAVASPAVFALGKPAVGVFLAAFVILPLVVVTANGGVGRRRETVGEALEALPAGLRFVALLITTMSLLWGVITFWVYGWANPVGYVLAGFLVPVGVLISGLKVEPPEEGEDDWFWDPANLASSHIQGTPAWHAYGRAMDDD